MKKKMSIGLVECALALAFLCCFVSMLLLGMCSLRMLAAGLILFVVCGAVLFLLYGTLRRSVRKALIGDLSGTSENLDALAKLPVPAAVLSEKRLIWYNEEFRRAILSGQEALLRSVSHTLPHLEAKYYLSRAGQDMELAGRRYTVYGSCPNAKDTTVVLYLIDDTVLKQKSEEYDASRPAVLHIVLDTYEELKKNLRVAELGRITGAVQDNILDYISSHSNGFVVRVSAERFLAVVEDRYLVKMMEERFRLLDNVRNLGGEIGMTTLSIGVSRGAVSLAAAEEAALTSLDMALGRGGDQAVVKDSDGYFFYGGVSHSVEKRSKVKARVIAGSLTELITHADNVVIMGHRLSDMDCLGAAAGILRICKLQNKMACIAVDRQHTLAGSLVKSLEAAGLEGDLVAPDEILPSVTPNTLLVIVDVHVPGLLESRALFDAIQKRVVIDHHRKMVGFIEDAMIFYHETYASSTCELVSELLQYLVGKDDKVLPAEADALLAGIMLDTREFTVHTGVRTFEAAAYLRRIGAQTASVKQLFAETLEAYTHKARIVTSAQVYKSCAIAVSDDLPESMRVVIPQAANDLLTIEGVKASFVAVRMDDTVNISARSMGDVNVQVIMEKMKGGGHLMMAGTQLDHITTEEARRQLLEAIDSYWKEIQ